MDQVSEPFAIESGGSFVGIEWNDGVLGDPRESTVYNSLFIRHSPPFCRSFVPIPTMVSGTLGIVRIIGESSSSSTSRSLRLALRKRFLLAIDVFFCFGGVRSLTL